VVLKFAQGPRYHCLPHMDPDASKAIHILKSLLERPGPTPEGG